LRKVPVAEAVGLELGHDITEIRPERGVKRRALRRGHRITAADVDLLADLGKTAVFVREGDEEDVHEDDAALAVAPRVAGPGIVHDAEPCEGRIAFRAGTAGVLRVAADRLLEIHRLGVPALPTLPADYPVRPGQTVAAFRIIPLTCTRALLDAVLAQLAAPLLHVDPYRVREAAVVVTGTEVHSGRIKDAFIPNLRARLAAFDVEVAVAEILPDDRPLIAAAVAAAADRCGLVLVTGGTSVDPDDVTAAAMADAGVDVTVRGVPLQPGNNLTIGYRGDAVVCGVPAGALMSRATALDVFLPRLLAGEHITRDQVARLGLGGLAQPGADDHFPDATFGRGGGS